jgi:formiminoglutamase
MTLPLLISVPHGGTVVPLEAAPFCVLSHEQLVRDGDEGAAEIYWPLEHDTEAFVAADVARAIVDVNRAIDDRRRDGVVKSATIHEEEIYRPFPPESVIETMLTRYYHPYHERLSALATSEVALGVDCHTMAAVGPPIGPWPGRERPWVCVSNANQSCPDAWVAHLARCIERVFATPVSVNEPFRGGFIIRSHATEIPWVQLELSRARWLSVEEKRRRTLAALGLWVETSDRLREAARHHVPARN